MVCRPFRYVSSGRKGKRRDKDGAEGKVLANVQGLCVCVCVCVFVCHCLATKVLYRLIASYWMGRGDHEVYTQGVKGNHWQTN